ncbi:MAG: glycosyltransferase [Bryobacterales bacterium]|nr:glycosyltransferase [Bryobacterales bacterium]
MLFDIVLWRLYVKVGDFDCLVILANHGILTYRHPSVVLQRNALLFHPLRNALYKGWKRRWKFDVQRSLALLACRSARLVVCPSRVMLDYVSRCISLDGRGRVVPHAFERREYLSPLNSDIAARFDHSSIKVLFVGLGAPHKNLGVVLRGIKLIPREKCIKLYLTIGEEDLTLRQSLLEQARRLTIEDRVVLLGNVGQSEIGELFRTVDVVVNPSIVESFGFVALEAMAFGAALLASDIEPNREICGDAALYFDPADPADLASRLLQLADPYVNAEFRSRALQRYEQVGTDWAVYLDQLMRVCTEAVNYGRD